MQLSPRSFAALAWIVLVPAVAKPQAMPSSLLGSWRIERILTSGNAACWDAGRAQTLVGTTLHYQPTRLNWKGGDAAITETLSRTLSRRKFQDEYKIDLPELGIRAQAVTELDLQHEDADFTGATTEAPGDTVVLAGTGRIVVSVCGVYYLAVKVPR